MMISVTEVICRVLYDYFLINRSIDGKDYYMNPERPDPDTLPAAYC